MDRLEHVIALRKRQEDYLFAVFINLDRFKGVNDSLGHMSSDRLLVAITDKLKSCLHPGDIARLSGDEFAVLLEDIKDVSDATHVVEQIQKLLTLPFNLNEPEISTKASIGIALSTIGDAPDAREIMGATGCTSM